MTASDLHPASNGASIVAIVTAYDEAERIAATLAALGDAFPGAQLWVADDGSTDGTAAIAETAGARVVRSERMIGKGGAATRAARAALRQIAQQARDHGAATTARADVRDLDDDSEPIVVFCDGDLGDSAARLAPLAHAVRRGDADVVVAAFERRVGGGLGLAVGFARWAIRRRAGLVLRAPISGQRALRASVLAQVLPFAHGFGMEIGMTIDAARAGRRVGELELDLSHHATGRTLAGFAHRGRQLVDFVCVYLARR
jgi:glycosyltransferase involved in cell wall biosynthesis